MVVSFVFLGGLVSQALFARTFGGPGDDGVYSIFALPDSSLAVAGYTASSGAGGADFLIIKLSSSGNLDWARTFGGPADDWAYSVTGASDDGLAIAGYTASSGAGGADFLIIKLSSSGNLEWARTFGGVGEERAYSVARTSDDGLAIAGYTASFGAGGTDFLILKLSPSGNLEWAKTFGGPQYDWASSIARTSDGGLAVAGYTASFGNGGADLLVLKISSSGNLDWANTFGGLDDEWAYSIAEIPGGDLVLAGYTSSFSAGPSDALVLRISPTGDLRWARTIGGGAGDYSSGVACSPDGGLFFAGYTSSFGAGWGDMFLFELGSTGNLVWARTFGGADDEQPSSIVATPQAGIVLAGRTMSSGAGSWDCVLLQIDTNGNYADCVYACSPTVSAPFTFTTLPAGLADCIPSQENPILSVATPGLVIADVCPPAVQENDVAPDHSIICSPLPGVVLFVSPEELFLRIYSADGRLTWSGWLMEGYNRITLETGIYFWRAGTYKGRVVVR